MKEKMRILLALLLLMGMLAGCSTTNVYLVRHAEKAAQPANDPPLTPAGERRAQALMDTLINKDIRYIYSTNTIRTRTTAEPLAQKLGLTILPYGTDTLWEVARQLTNLRGRNALVVGHSNTLLPLMDQLPVTHNKKSIPDSDYDNLFVVMVKKRFLRPPLIRLQEKTYGEWAE
jgi:phosphohistidine phosphatase SixA